jgi:Helix-turn-helix domain
MKERIVITEAAAAAVFASPRQRDIVQTLMAEEMTAAELARATHTPLSLSLYHMSKCVALGLIEVVRQKRRAGRAAKYYRATAKTFFVPAELMVELPGTRLTQQLRQALDAFLARATKGVNFSHDGHGPRVELVKEPTEQPPMLELWLDVNLSKADGRRCASELKAVIDRFQTSQSNKEPRHLVHVALVRV